MITDASDKNLVRYYALRAAVAVGWVGAAFTLGRSTPAVRDALLIAYPAWDALANGLDARAHGGLSANRSQAINVAVSAATSLAMAIALTRGLNAALGVFGVWAALAGVLQLAAGLKRWRTVGSQWAMVLSGAQSALAGFVFVKGAFGAVVPGIEAFAPYAAFGAFYFLVSAVSLSLARRASIVRRASTS
jgi:hypothetical protein